MGSQGATAFMGAGSPERSQLEKEITAYVRKCLLSNIKQPGGARASDSKPEEERGVRCGSCGSLSTCSLKREPRPTLRHFLYLSCRWPFYVPLAATPLLFRCVFGPEGCGNLQEDLAASLSTRDALHIAASLSNAAKKNSLHQLRGKRSLHLPRCTIASNRSRLHFAPQGATELRSAVFKSHPGTVRWS